MLVVTANWAFTDGTIVAARGRARAARAWLRSIRLAAIRSGFGRDGMYQPPPVLHVVLAGDTFHCLASTSWLGRDRPWRGGERVRAARHRAMLACARRGRPLLAGLARLARSGLAAPATDRRGRPAAAAFVRVPVQVSLLEGDRDRHTAETAAAGAWRDASIAPAWFDGAVLIRHGHEFDPACYGVAVPCDDERPPTLGESVAVDLIAPFASGVTATGVVPRPVGVLVEALVDADLPDIAGVMAAWAAADAPGGTLGGDVRRRVVSAWRFAVDDWLRAARDVPPECGASAAPLDALAEWFQAARTGPPPALLADLFHRMPPAAAGGGSARMTVFGHPTPAPHRPGMICLGRSSVRRWQTLEVMRGQAGADCACIVPTPALTGPVTVTCRRDGERLEWQILGGGDANPVDFAADAATIVDAA